MTTMALAGMPRNVHSTAVYSQRESRLRTGLPGSHACKIENALSVPGVLAGARLWTWHGVGPDELAATASTRTEAKAA